VESLGWVADTVASGREALEQIEQANHSGHHYDVVFMDWRMPDMDGWQTTSHIREISTIEQSPVIIMVTAHDRELLTKRLRANPMTLDGFLVKPVTVSMLFDAVADAKANEIGIKAKTMKLPTSNRLVGLNLLVVEDNQINQQVARELLSSEGAVVAVADNGKLGVEAVLTAQPPFDAVLMDIQMPVMDGYSSTAAIRSHSQLKSLPIIAMTANALASDKETCLAAGMNDHIGKPIDLDTLVQTILHHCKRETPAMSIHADEHAPKHNINNPFENALNRLGQNRSLFIAMASKFVHSTATLAVDLQHSLDNKAKDDAVLLLHTLQGTAGTVGAMDLVKYAAELEQKLRLANNMTSVGYVVESFDALIQQSCAGLLAFTEVLKSSDPTENIEMVEMDKSEIIQILDKLDDLMRKKSMRATLV
ncbi:MAG TPA: response regulator, partial [Aquirhabdus sp.]